MILILEILAMTLIIAAAFGIFCYFRALWNFSSKPVVRVKYIYVFENQIEIVNPLNNPLN